MYKSRYNYFIYKYVTLALQKISFFYKKGDLVCEHLQCNTRTVNYLQIVNFQYMRQYQKLSNFWQGKNIKTSVFRTCILITQNTEQVLRISELLSVIQNSYIYGNHGNFKMELTLPVPSCYQSLTFFRRL